MNKKRKKRKFKRSGRFWVYILRCADETYYTGHTNDLKRRLKQHDTGKGGALYTKWKKAKALVWSKKYKYFKLAFLEEMRIKKLTREQKEELVKKKYKSKVRRGLRSVLKGNKGRFKKGQVNHQNRVSQNETSLNSQSS